ncbi:unannotated protein [freshwater metagenome]|uniref:Unannotated protein n=1 Tax=freshwater metagenome TaxID=449393 RepID=A0A6J7UQK4_9ZZZZ
MASKSSGTSGTSSLSRGGSLCTCLYAIATGFSPVNGGRPVVSSYITMPREYRSLRGSGWAPCACSGEK